MEGGTPKRHGGGSDARATRKGSASRNRDANKEASAKRGRRRSFSQSTLATTSEGPLGAPLAVALQAAGASGYSLTHAFHAYPGRFHPLLVYKVLAAVARPGQTLFDPFMGGGTTLVEGMTQGLATLGNDLNPIAHLVARERTRIRTGAEARMVEAELNRLSVQVESLRREKHPPRHERPTQHRITPHYQPHMLAELMQWIRLIDTLRDEDIRHTLRALFSGAVVKFSNMTSDSRQETGEPPRYPKGAVSRYLMMKGEELVRAQVMLASRVPPGTPAPTLLEEDARLLPSLAWDVCDLIITSPPYPGTYDYYEHHRLRMDWLDLDSGAFAQGEMAPGRERPTFGADAPESWSAGFKDVLGTLARVLRPGGNLFLVVGDWISGGHAVNAGGMITRIAREAGWSPVSTAAAQREPHSLQESKVFSRKGKWEHLLHFQRAGSAGVVPTTTPASTHAASPGPTPRTGPCNLNPTPSRGAERKGRPPARKNTPHPARDRDRTASSGGQEKPPRRPAAGDTKRGARDSSQPPLEVEQEPLIDIPATAKRVVSRRKPRT